MTLAAELNWNYLRLKQNIKDEVKIVIKKYIETNLKEFINSFDFNSIKIFKDYVCQVNISGKRQWFNPTYAAAIDLKDQKINENEDIIVYHGMKDPKNSLPKILKQGLKEGKGQGYANSEDYAKQGKIPVGVYASQFMNTTLGYTNISEQLVLQCAARNIYLCSKKDYLVSTSIRPIKLVFPFSQAPREELQ